MHGNAPWLSILVVASSIVIAVGAVATVQPAGSPAAAAGTAPASLAAWLRGAAPLGEVVIEGEHDHAAMALQGDWVADAGPRDAAALLQACPARDEPCLLHELALVLESRGAEAAFGMLEAAGAMDAAVQGNSHPLAHELGRHALVLYGGVRAAMENCSYEVFAGCFHGALQHHFEALDHPVGPADLQGLCPTGNPFREYTCLHGAGHGLFLATKHDLQGSLTLCDALPTVFAQGSCHGGVYMENVVGYFDSLTGAHHHGPEGEVQPYRVDKGRPEYPCSEVAPVHQHSCWLMQTSLILHFNGGNFAEGARICGTIQAEHQLTCYRSLGRDAAPYTNRDPMRMVSHCSHALTPAGQTACTQGFVAESVLQFNSPEAGLRLCRIVPEQDKLACYGEVGWQSRGMVDAATLARLCDTAESPAYAQECRALAGA